MTDNAAKNVAYAQIAYNETLRISAAAFKAHERAEHAMDVAQARADEAYVVYRTALIEAGTKIDG